MIRWRVPGWSAVLLMGLAGGCESTVEVTPTTSSTGMGASGAAGGSNGGNGGSGAFGGSGGSGAFGGTGGSGALGGGDATGGTFGTTTPMCDPAQCPAPSSECKVAACGADGACIEENASDGQALPRQVSGDCKQDVCQGGVATAVSQDTDTQDDGQDCTADTCEAGQPKHDPLLFVACDQMGGKVCDSGGSGACVACNFDADCAGEPGGKIYCDPAHVCVIPGCMDGSQNGAETDVDCGGLECEECSVGQMCQTEADCLSTICDGGVCVQEALGAPCGVAGECASGYCVDGVCCDLPCSDVCEACVAAKKGGGLDGHCGPMPDGTDPDDDCAVSSPSSCQLTGVCVGGTCGKHPAGTACAAASCAGPFSLDPADLCDGDGVCVASLTIDCTPYACASGSCMASCMTDASCAVGFYCIAATQCVAKKVLGQPCAAAGECQSSFCTDGVCCDGACAGTCEACIAAKKGAGVDGVCGAVAGGWDPDSECGFQSASTCGTTGVCNGAGACQLYPPGTLCSAATCVFDGDVLLLADLCNGSGVCVDGGSQDCAPFGCSNAMCAPKGGGAPCLSNASCLSNLCVDGVCCNAACVGTCQACSAPKTGLPSGVCALIPANTDPDNECATECSGQGTCEAPNGFPCSQASQCQSGLCVDGVCCNNVCAGACKACNQAGSVGTCSNVPNGLTDTCPFGQSCMSGACQ